MDDPTHVEDITSSPCYFCRAWTPLLEDIERRVFNRIWACYDCKARKLHGSPIILT